MTSTRNSLVHSSNPFTFANSTDWALHTNEGLKQKNSKEGELIKSEKAKCETLCAHFRGDSPTSSMVWSYLRPYIYVCDGTRVCLYNSRETSPTKCCDFLAYDEVLIEDSISDMTIMNDLTHELLMTGTRNGLVEIWDPMFSEHSHEIQAPPKLITAAYLLSDETRFDVKNSKNNTLYQWDQNHGRIACSGNVRICRLWDAWSEKGVLDLPTKSKISTTSIAMDLSSNLISCGLTDGTLKIYDVRLPPDQTLIMELRHFSTSIVGSKILSNGQLVAGSSYGDVRIWEPRMYCEPVVEFQALDKYDNGLTTMKFMDIQSSAEIIACAFNNSSVRMFDISGSKCLSQISLLPPPAVGRHIAPQSSSLTNELMAMRFHQGQILLGVATKDKCVSIYGLPQS